ncbi:MAG: hypothetical protein IJW23_01800 [Lentisphaeria bacterium]|nr:hypothetical protein [Lentisphaeria bacterium]
MAKWMSPANAPESTYITVYRNCFSVQSEQNLEFEFSADNRAQLYLDGQLLINGPERGAAEYWYLQRVKTQVPAGDHVLTARVISVRPADVKLREYAYAQMSIRPGFYINEKTSLLNGWEYQLEKIHAFVKPFPDWGTFPRVHLKPDHNSGILSGIGGEWEPVAYFEDERVLHEPDLPLMRHEKIEPDQIAPGLYYFKQYVCVWTDYKFKGKGTVRIRWSETPYLTDEFDSLHLKGKKGNRDGKFFVGTPDVFEVDGETVWQDFWWKAGHYLEISVEGDVSYEANFYLTGYPYKEFKPRSELEKMAFETLQACSFETYMDCPYYEQLQYLGDSRLEALCTYLITDDHRLIRKALRMFSLSQRPDGSLNAQYPSCSIQTIPSFMLVWLLMLQDYHKHHGNDDLVMELRPRAEKLLKFLFSNIKDDLIRVPGWNFFDWCDCWESGVPPGGELNSAMNFMFVLAMQSAADMGFGENLREQAARTAAKIRETFYDEERNLYALDIEKKHFSEHSQVLALLTVGDKSVIPGLRTVELTPCSIYFSYYYLEACLKYELNDLREKRLDRWRALCSEGLTTFPEEFDNPRSDCHAWSSHILGILLKM